jgi:hypothetical protein
LSRRRSGVVAVRSASSGSARTRPKTTPTSSPAYRSAASSSSARTAYVAALVTIVTMPVPLSAESEAVDPAAVADQPVLVDLPRAAGEQAEQVGQRREQADPGARERQRLVEQEVAQPAEGSTECGAAGDGADDVGGDRDGPPVPPGPLT